MFFLSDSNVKKTCIIPGTSTGKILSVRHTRSVKYRMLHAQLCTTVSSDTFSLSHHYEYRK